MAQSFSPGRGGKLSSKQLAARRSIALREGFTNWLNAGPPAPDTDPLPVEPTPKPRPLAPAGAEEVP